MDNSGALTIYKKHYFQNFIIHLTHFDLRLFEDVYKNSEENKYREEALYNLGDIHSYLLNPYKDFDKALYYLDLLLTQFPDSSFKEKAEEKKKSILLLKDRAK